MSHEQMSAIESNNTTTMQRESLSVTSHVELLVMPRRTLKLLLGESGLSLEGTLAANLMLDSETPIVVVASLDDEWPRDPPPVEERRMITALRDDSVLELSDQDLKSNLMLGEQVQLMEARLVSDLDIDGLVVEGVGLVSDLDVTGLEAEGLRIESSLNVAGLEQAEPRALGCRTVRRSRQHWRTRARVNRDTVTLATATDGFNPPPDVG